MVYAVRRRRIEDALQRPEPRDPVGVDPELVEQIDGERGSDGAWREAEPGQRQKVKQRAGDAPGPAKAVGRAEVEAVRAVVHGVRGPEPADAVRAAVEPVVEELDAEEQQHPAPCGMKRSSPYAVLVEPESARQR